MSTVKDSASLLLLLFGAHYVNLNRNVDVVKKNAAKTNVNVHLIAVFCKAVWSEAVQRVSTATLLRSWFNIDEVIATDWMQLSNLVVLSARLGILIIRFNACRIFRWTVSFNERGVSTLHTVYTYSTHGEIEHSYSRWLRTYIETSNYRCVSEASEMLYSQTESSLHVSLVLLLHFLYVSVPIFSSPLLSVVLLLRQRSFCTTSCSDSAQHFHNVVRCIPRNEDEFVESRKTRRNKLTLFIALGFVRNW